MINKARYGLGEPDQGSVEKARSNLNSVLDILNNRLEEAPYFAGSEFSLADIAYMPEMEYLVVSNGPCGGASGREGLGQRGLGLLMCLFMGVWSPPVVYADGGK